jgi:hypothetical protein
MKEFFLGGEKKMFLGIFWGEEINYPVMPTTWFISWQILTKRLLSVGRALEMTAIVGIAAFKSSSVIVFNCVLVNTCLELDNIDNSSATATAVS